MLNNECSNSSEISRTVRRKKLTFQGNSQTAMLASARRQAAALSDKQKG